MTGFELPVTLSSSSDGYLTHLMAGKDRYQVLLSGKDKGG
jgi:hypothetical protein